MADKLNDADYGFKVSTQPMTPETRTFGQLFAHVAQSQFGTCAAVEETANPVQGQQLEQTLKTKAEVTKALADSFAFCDDAFSSVTEQNALEMVKQGQGTIARAAALANLVSHSNEMYRRADQLPARQARRAAVDRTHGRHARWRAWRGPRRQRRTGRAAAVSVESSRTTSRSRSFGALLRPENGHREVLTSDRSRFGSQ